MGMAAPASAGKRPSSTVLVSHMDKGIIKVVLGMLAVTGSFLWITVEENTGNRRELVNLQCIFDQGI